MAYETQNSFAAGELSPLLHYRTDSEIRAAGVKSMLNMYALAHGPAVSRFGFEYKNQITDTYARLFSFKSGPLETMVIIGVNYIYLLDIDGDILTTVGSPYTEAAIRSIQSVIEPNTSLEDGVKLHLFTREDIPRHLRFKGLTFEIIDTEFEFQTWTDPPGSAVFHNGRLFVGGTYSEAVTVWGSKPNDYYNFNVGNSDSADDALYLPLANPGEISWLEATDKLFVGLDTGEVTIYAKDFAVTPMDAHTDQQSNFGSRHIQAKIVENLVVYANVPGDVIRGLLYSDKNEKYNSVDLSFQSEHILDSGVAEIKYVSSLPGARSMSFLWCVLDNGHMSVMSINSDQQVHGWHRHEVGDEVVSIAILREDDTGLDIPWILVRRNGVLSYEKYGSEYMDSYLEFNMDPPSDTISGLDHLIGREVSTIADDILYPDQTVDVNGEINLGVEVSNATVGLGFIAGIESLPQSNDLEKGNSLNFFKRFSKIFVSLLDSARPIVNGYDTFKRSAETTMGVRESNKTEIIEVSNSGWTTDANITVEQPRPLSLVIGALGGKLKENKL